MCESVRVCECVCVYRFLIDVSNCWVRALHSRIEIEFTTDTYTHTHIHAGTQAHTHLGTQERMHPGTQAPKHLRTQVHRQACIQAYRQAATYTDRAVHVLTYKNPASDHQTCIWQSQRQSLLRLARWLGSSCSCKSSLTSMRKRCHTRTPSTLCCGLFEMTMRSSNGRTHAHTHARTHVSMCSRTAARILAHESGGHTDRL